MTEQPLGPVGQRIESKLKDAFAPRRLQVIDESSLHAGHAGARPEGETHFRVRMESAEFAGMSRLARQRRVYKLLAEEMSGRVHALALELSEPARGV